MVTKFIVSSLVIITGVVTIILLYDLGVVDKCSTRQFEIMGNIGKYDQTKDPELCSQLNEKISQFDNQCSQDLEELDCG